MKFKIYRTQFNTATKFVISHRLDKLIEYKVNSYLSSNPISKYSDLDEINVDIKASEGDFVYLFGECSILKKDNGIYQHLYLNSNELICKDDYILHPKKFDFVLKKDAYKTFSKELYVSRVITALSALFENEPLLSLLEELLGTIRENPKYYEFKNEDHEYLIFLLSEEGKEWLKTKEASNFVNTDAFVNWSRLIDKYDLDDSGEVGFER